MPFFRVIAAKNNQKVELTAKFDSELSARESLHHDGYSIIEIRETAAPAEVVGNVFYFEIELQGQKKSGQIRSDDIFKAYKKLVDDLGYRLISIAATADASDEEKAYTTAKARESYDEFKRRNAPASAPQPTVSKNEKTESTEQEGVFAREVRKYQTIISIVYNKLELFINTHSENLGEDRVAKIKELLPVLRQMRQASNIDKLRIVGEASLMKIGELEMELLAKNKKLERSQFLKETNSLLKDLGSSKRVGNDLDIVKKKLGEFFQEMKNTAAPEEKTVEKKIDTSSFAFLKNLRELSLYQERLKAIRKEILKSFFGDAKKKKRLVLKKRLIEQNISIIESRISKRKFSYTKLVKGIKYYEEVFAYLVRSLSDAILYSFAATIMFFCAFSIVSTPLTEQLLKIVFIGSVFATFVVIFNGVRSFFGIGLGFGIFFLVSLALQINF